jgi:pyruvate,water dikinase
MEKNLICWFKDKRCEELSRVGGKNSSLSKMIRGLSDAGVRVPDGFATTAEAYREFLRHHSLDAFIQERLELYRQGKKNLHETGRELRQKMESATLPPELESELIEAFVKLRESSATPEGGVFSVAVRSSATAEDLPEASFAGQLESFLNVSTAETLRELCRKCFASLYTDRAILYREEKKLAELDIAVSVGVQQMVRSDLACSGVMFSLDTESGFPRVVMINSSWGLGEAVVQGWVNPDEYLVFKPHLKNEAINPVIQRKLGGKEKKVVYSISEFAADRTQVIDTPRSERQRLTLTDAEARKLALWAVQVENFYGRPMDLEWAKNGWDGELYLVQARPETVHASQGAQPFKRFLLEEPVQELRRKVLVQGSAIGSGIASGPAKILSGPEEMDQLQLGDVLVAAKTDPDWVPAMRKARAIVTEHGGRTSHAAIVSRELGIPAVIGAEGARERIPGGAVVTVSCAEGETGSVYSGLLNYSEEMILPEGLPRPRIPILLIIASPEASFRWWRLPVSGIGLARIEFIITHTIRVHPMALIHPEKVSDQQAIRLIEDLTVGYSSKTEFFIDRLSRGMAKIAASQFPNPVIVRFSDFKTNEYAALIGGRAFEPQEENPMLGFRGASRYYDPSYRDGFALECQALKKARQEFGMQNIIPMIPFCRTPEEADQVLAAMSENGLRRGEEGLEIYVMAEIPSNVWCAGEFAERFDGFSIGSNDLTQLVLGVDRDSAILKRVFNERHPAVKRAISMLITEVHARGKKVGICGQAPSDYPEFAEFLLEQGIDSIALNPDRVVEMLARVSEIESRIGKVA